MESLFKAFASGGKIVFNNSEDLSTYAHEHEGQEFSVRFTPIAKGTEKEAMYAYYHTAILDSAVMGFTYRGYEGIDKVKADYLLRAELAKDFIKKPDGSFEAVMMDKKNMTKARLLKYVQDAIMYIEINLEQRVPDADEWKHRKAGRNFRVVGRK